MPTYFQADRALSVTTPLPANSLLLVGVSGYEGISTLFRFDFQLLAENSTPIAFEKLLGQKTTAKIHLQDNEQRFVSGVVSRVSQGSRDADFTTYRMEVVPQFWFLTNRQQSRIFQFISVPDILKKVLAGLDVIYEIQGTFEQRNYCVQYRETDFEFASRLMEEEGIYYFFKHTSTGHTMVLANTPQSHTEISPAKVIFEEITGGNRPDERISIWEKSQELRSGKTTLWDFNFEFPGKHLEADKSIVDSVLAGTVTHPFKLANNDKMELYDFPGDYATRFDGVDRGGSPRPPELQKIFQDNKRTAGIRMQEEASQGLVIQGSSSCPRLTAGHRFTLERHFNADGVYVLTGVEIRATMSGDYRSGEGAKLDFESGFTCVPLALPFRPARVTPPPRVFGTQTATVVGPAGDEIFTDKYGRVKVQFHWDREGKNDADSSCWVRVSTNWGRRCLLLSVSIRPA
jgi:type VI secretion system secreted protein VgrG